MSFLFFRRLCYRLSRTDILFWTLPAMMILIAVGTIAQKDLGIYAAQKTFFTSWITFIGILPFPGGRLLIAILFVNMLMKFLLFSEWRRDKVGVILTHFGVLLLIGGGMVTSVTEREGYMAIGEGEKSSSIEDYYQRVLEISRDGKTVLSVPHQKLRPGLRLENPSLPFTLEIDVYCFNCAIRMRDPASVKGWNGPGRSMALTPAKQLPQQEENLTGIEFTLSGSNVDGKYLTFDKFPKPPTMSIDGHAYKIEIAHAQRALPFDLTLKHFEREFHPGSDMAKSYRSDLVVSEGNGSVWPVSIAMNKPFRHRGYTFYQSSFDISGDKTFTVLNVVENSGRLFPYVSTVLMAAGLILHMVLRGRKR